jgi:hypothetical protein
MKFDNTPTSDGGSYEKPEPGKYLGILVGFSFVGIQPGNGQYAPRPQVMLRWELHKRKGPSIDSKNFVHTVTASFGATVRGENSKLRKTLAAHGVDIPEGGSSESCEWLGKAAWLDIELSDDRKYINVVNVSRYDPVEDDLVKPEQVLDSISWEGAPDEKLCPSWAAWAVARSTDLSDRAPKFAGGKRSEKQPVRAGIGATNCNNDPNDEENIPF